MEAQQWLGMFMFMSHTWAELYRVPFPVPLHRCAGIITWPLCRGGRASGAADLTAAAAAAAAGTVSLQLLPSRHVRCADLRMAAHHGATSQ